MNDKTEKLVSCVRAYMESVYEDDSLYVQELARRAMFLALALYDQARKKETP